MDRLKVDLEVSRAARAATHLLGFLAQELVVAEVGITEVIFHLGRLGKEMEGEDENSRGRKNAVLHAPRAGRSARGCALW